jgi:hypothetical protein
MEAVVVVCLTVPMRDDDGCTVRRGIVVGEPPDCRGSGRAPAAAQKGKWDQGKQACQLSASHTSDVTGSGPLGIGTFPDGEVHHRGVRVVVHRRGRSALLLLGLLGASCTSTLPPGDGPGNSGKLLKTEFCHQVVWSGAAQPGVVKLPLPPVLDPPVIVQVAPGCSRGASLSISPAGLFSIAASAVARDARTAAVYLTVVGQPERGVHTAILTITMDGKITTAQLRVTVS